MHNPVAKFMHRFNKSNVVEDKRRKAKSGHRKHKRDYRQEV